MASHKWQKKDYYEEKATSGSQGADLTWILDSGTSMHVAGGDLSGYEQHRDDLAELSTAGGDIQPTASVAEHIPALGSTEEVVRLYPGAPNA